MAGSMEKKDRSTLWEMLRDLPNLALLNGKGSWHVFPRWKKGRIRFRKTNPPVTQTVSRGPPDCVIQAGSIVTSIIISPLVTPFLRRNLTRLAAVLISLFLTTMLLAADITITGQYLDKKRNPIAGAAVKYISNIIQLDSTSTDNNGNFTLQINTVGIESEAIPNQFHLGQNYPNPFNPETCIPVSTPYPVTLSLYNIRGQLVDKINIPVGRYDIIWGGLDRNGKPVGAGIYIVQLKGNDVRLSKRITLLDGGRQSGLKIQNPQSGTRQSELAKINTLDEIYFIKPNTSTKVIQLTTVTQDTSLGIITGNPGPSILQRIPFDSCYTDEYRDWNLNTFVQNDGDSRFSLKDTAEFHFMNASYMLKFESQVAGIYSATLYITDITDPVLTDSMHLTYKVLAGGSPATLPWQFADIPDQSIDEDDTLRLDMLQYVYDGQWPDITDYGVDSLPHAAFMHDMSDVRIIPDPDYNGAIDSIVIWVKDQTHTQRVYLNPFDLNVLPVNDLPRLTLETLLESVGEDTSGLPIAIANFTIFDPDTGRDGYFDIYLGVIGNSGDYDDITINMDGSQDDIMEQYQKYSGQVFLEKLVKHSNGYKEYGIMVYCSYSLGFAEEYTKITVEPREEPIINVTFRFKAAYPDTLLETGVNTLQLTPLDDEWRENPIKEFQEISVEGNACITAPVSSLMDVNGMNNNSADGWYGIEFLFLKKGSDILEQRAREDIVSVVDFNELADGDTIDVYKIMDTKQLDDIFTYFDKYSQGTRMFPRNSIVTVWWNTSGDYNDPDSTYLAWTKEAMDHLTSLPNVEYNYQMIISDGPQPAYPVLEIIWDPHLSTPQNITSFNIQNEITKAQVKTTYTSSKSNFLTEIWEGTTDSYEMGGHSALVTELDENNDTKYNYFGDALYSINYLGLPKTNY